MEFRNAQEGQQQHHPYYPQTLRINHYIPNRIPMESLLLTVGSVMALLIITSFVLAAARKSSKTNKNKKGEALRFTWFVLCIFLHCGFEAYWVYHHKTIAGQSDLLAELWKEYAHGDSRYLSSDPVLLALETITVFVWGPLCCLAARAIWMDDSKQYLWQLLASMAHLFSTTLYFVMDLPTGFASCNPHPLYFWVYFVSFNSPWFIVPAILLVQSFKTISSSLSVAAHDMDVKKCS
ncbi:Emopamil binding protein-domain-containing protein [Zychaea mexicana]|uniref:Emopamil binding protein-domain-containing protein n=1 Tax=Zychaea mexicana TaxID=64656 RepID=UPI0022FE7813|nr:Emopamil binding protein-domain-containing protein [Zychaea mexicana]KAI9492993.1 Emopamil binding protein-domain-containing protein [Zychaea mexicana]